MAATANVGQNSNKYPNTQKAAPQQFQYHSQGNNMYDQQLNDIQEDETEVYDDMDYAVAEEDDQQDGSPYSPNQYSNPDGSGNNAYHSSTGGGNGQVKNFGKAYKNLV